MAEEGFKRKLAAILSADVEGYSRLMDDDEEATVRTLTSYRNAITDLTQQFRGRVVDSPGDNILAEFSSVVDAVNCAVEIQRELAERNTELPYKRQMHFRIGVNLGDVIEEDGRIYGDGVNIAARVESLAEAGGVCISSRAYEQVMNKLGLKYEDLGEHQVKNISVPIRVYKVLSFPGAAAHRVAQAKESLGKRWRKFAVSAAVVIAVMGGLAYWQFYMRSPDVEPASVEKMAYPLPEKPSIAVLPFVNMSEYPKQEYLSDGITEQIITTLSKVPSMFVIARTSTFAYKDKPVKVQQVSEELGVRYVLEGSVQRSEDRIRITAQLIDAINGKHMWAQRYDRELNDIFELQDEITLKIIRALQVKLTRGEQVNIWGKNSPSNIEYIEKVFEAEYYMNQWNKESTAKAKQLLKEAIDLEPDSWQGYALLAAAHGQDVWLGTSSSPRESMGKSFKLSKKAISLDDKQDFPHLVIGHIYLHSRKYDLAIKEIKQALALNPNSAEAYIYLGQNFAWSGRPEEGIESIKKGMRLSPFPNIFSSNNLAIAYREAGRYDEAIAEYGRCLKLSPNSILVNLGLSMTYALAGRFEDAREAYSELLKIDPEYSLEKALKTYPYRPERLKVIKIAFEKAGLPPNPSLPLPDKPSIAVLAFDNLSDDPEQEYFSDGITDDLITDLSKISGLFVVARNSTFSFKGQHKKVQQIGKELGVRYVLEGSVRKYENKVRINAQLIDAQTGGHLWAERYDRDYKEIFALQDEVINKIVSALSVTLTSDEKDQIGIQKTVNMKAYDYYLRGLNILHRIEGETISEAKTMFELAIENDPGFANAYAAHAMANQFIYRFRLQKAGIGFKKALKQAHEYVNKALELNSKLAAAYSVLGSLELGERHFDKAIEYSQKAVSLDPNDPEGYVMLGYHLTKAGEHQQALETIQKAFRLNPIHPQYYFLYLGHIQINNRQYRKAIESIKKAGPDTPGGFRYELVVSHVYLGEMEEAKKELSVIEKDWRVNIFSLNRLFFLRDEADQDHWLDAFRKLGVQEYPFAYEGDERNILSKEEVLDLIVDKKITGIDPKKGQFWIHHTKDGKWRSTGAYKFDGTYWLEDNKLCHTVSSHPGFIDYVFFYRNPGGTSLGKNEYYMYYPFFGTWTVSVEK